MFKKMLKNILPLFLILTSCSPAMSMEPEEKIEALLEEAWYDALCPSSDSYGEMLEAQLLAIPPFATTSSSSTENTKSILHSMDFFQPTYQTQQHQNKAPRQTTCERKNMSKVLAWHDDTVKKELVQVYCCRQCGHKCYHENAIKMHLNRNHHLAARILQQCFPPKRLEDYYIVIPALQSREHHG